MMEYKLDRKLSLNESIKRNFAYNLIENFAIKEGNDTSTIKEIDFGKHASFHLMDSDGKLAEVCYEYDVST